jgi:enoyl-CoA hydratase
MAEPFIVEQSDAVAVVRLQVGKANAMGPAFLRALDAALDQAAGSRAVVLTGYERYFCAGLDLPTLYGFDRAALGAFMEEFDRLVLRVFAWPAPVVMAVNGHAVAGGCILALAGDVRLLARGDGKMGLNEIELGIPFPTSALEVARAALPPAHLETILYGGQLYDPEELHAKGIVDGLANPESVVIEALEVARYMATKPAMAFGQIKAALRKPYIDRILADRGAGTDRFLEAWFHADARSRVGQACELLGKRRRQDPGSG